MLYIYICICITQLAHECTRAASVCPGWLHSWVRGLGMCIVYQCIYICIFITQLAHECTRAASVCPGWLHSWVRG
jgi:hypothetical protein